MNKTAHPNADFAKYSKMKSKLCRVIQSLDLQRLTRHILHLIKTITQIRKIIWSPVFDVQRTNCIGQRRQVLSLIFMEVQPLLF